MSRPPKARCILPDVLRPGLRLVFCGMAAGMASARLGAYYAGPGNKFWPTVHRIGLLPRLQPNEFRKVLRHGIGLTDLAKSQSGRDGAIHIREEDRHVLEQKIARTKPGVLAFVGKRAACGFFACRRIGYGWQEARVGDASVFVLPSTSGAANAYWDEDPWFQLASFMREQR